MNHTHKKQRFLFFQSQSVHKKKKNAGAINPEFKLQMMESWHIYQRLFNLGLIRNQANSKIIIWWVFFYSRENYFLLMQ